jgi:DNA-binding winged helix-turn-helix (wHTH) protein/tetratricopeptide (TPR) repeat protein
VNPDRLIAPFRSSTAEECQNRNDAVLFQPLIISNDFSVSCNSHKKKPLALFPSTLSLAGIYEDACYNLHASETSPDVSGARMDESADRKSSRHYEFGPFRVDPDKELLLRNDETVPLAPKALQILLVLVRHSKQVVTKDDLLKTVWPDTFVEEANLSRNIFLLRKALGEKPQDHQYIVTVPGRGYRFAEDVQLVPQHELDIVAASHAKVEVEVKENRPWGWIALPALVLIGCAAGGYWFFFGRGQALKARDTVMLADFANSTGDPIFDGTLRQGLAFALEQSPYLSLVDDAKTQRDLRLMNVAPGAPITRPIAHDACVREGGTATIEGAIASLGKRYAITLETIACRDGKTLAREQVEAEDKEHVLRALDKAATAMRHRLGESLKSIQELNQPLEQATTSSLEALQDYTEGLAVMGRGQFRAALPLYERAIAIDPKFTMAYYVIGVVYEQAGDLERSAEYAGKAFSLADRVSEIERTEITAYHYRATGDLDKEIDAYQIAVRENYPRVWSFHNQLALTYNDMGRFEDGLRDGLEAVRLVPDLEAPYRRVLDSYLCLGRFGEADRMAAEVRAHGIDGARIHQRFLELGYLEDDSTATAREIQWYAGKPDEYLSFGLQAAALNMHGQRRASHALYQRAADAARHQGLRYVADDFEEADARADALSGKCQSVHSLGRPAFALSLCGESERAEKLAVETSKAQPNGTIWNAVQLPEIEAMLALKHNDPAAAVYRMTAAAPYERAYPDAIYVRGLAYLKMHKGVEAAAEFQKIIDHKGANWGATWVHPTWGQYYSLARLGMARGFAVAGDAPNAKNAFEEFFRLWKDADPDIPVLRQARVEYAKLQ